MSKGLNARIVNVGDTTTESRPEMRTEDKDYNMTDINTIADATQNIEVKHFDILLDKDGKEIRVEVNPSGTAEAEENKTETETQPN